MRILFAAVFLATLFGAAMPPALADRSATGPTLLEDFTMLPETRWRFFTDQVMGGVSTGSIGFVQDGGTLRSSATSLGHLYKLPHPLHCGMVGQ